MRENREKKWQSLTLADDFLFSKTMPDTLLCAEMLHRIFPKLDVSEIRPVEAQNRGLKDMSKRPRAYHIIIGYDGLNVEMLRDSGNYKYLPDAYAQYMRD